MFFGNVLVVRQTEQKIYEKSTMTITATSNRNPGIVPPWLNQPQGKNPGIVPPWLQSPITILPIEDPITILPIDEDPEFTILPVDGDTQFVRESIDLSPTSLIDALRAR